MLAVKRVKLPASAWLNRQDKPLPRRGMFPVKICEIHSLGRYSRSLFIGVPPPIAPQKWTRGKERKITACPFGVYSPLMLAVSSATGKTTEYQSHRIRYWRSAHWRTESLPSVWRKSSNDGVSERREMLQGAPLSKTSWRGVFLFVIERTFRLFFKILLTNRYEYDILYMKDSGRVYSSAYPFIHLPLGSQNSQF